MKRSLTQKLGLLGVVSFLSYTAAVVFAPLTYPGYRINKGFLRILYTPKNYELLIRNTPPEISRQLRKCYSTVLA